MVISPVVFAHSCKLTDRHADKNTTSLVDVITIDFTFIISVKIWFCFVTPVLSGYLWAVLSINQQLYRLSFSSSLALIPLNDLKVVSKTLLVYVFQSPATQLDVAFLISTSGRLLWFWNGKPGCDGSLWSVILIFKVHSEELNLLSCCFWTIWMTHTFSSARTLTHARTHTHACTYPHTHTHTHTDTHTHTKSMQKWKEDKHGDSLASDVWSVFNQGSKQLVFITTDTERSHDLGIICKTRNSVSQILPRKIHIYISPMVYHTLLRHSISHTVTDTRSSNLSITTKIMFMDRIDVELFFLHFESTPAPPTPPPAQELTNYLIKFHNAVYGVVE